MAESVDRFPLFPLPLVLLPSEVIPLHIFEERYKLMMGECLEQGSEFGVLWLSDEGLREVGCSAEITQVLDRFDDGRLNVLVRGSRPFGLVRRIDDMPYPAGDVEMLEDDEGADGALAASARESYGDLVEHVTDERPAAEEVEELDAYAMAATIEFGAEAKQELLELRSEDDRLRKLSELFTETVKQIERKERAGELAKSNGKVRF
jgi:Lon protease-like protein